MKAVKVDKGAKSVKVVFADEKQEKKQQRQTKLAVLAEKKAKDKLTLEDVDEKLDIMLEMLKELLAK